MNALSDGNVPPTLESVRGTLVAFAHAHPEIRRLVVFGSVARGDARVDSDVDVVAELAPGGTPHGMAGFSFMYDLECELATRLGRSVHLLTQGSVDNACRIGNRALPEAVARDGKSVYELESATA